MEHIQHAGSLTRRLRSQTREEPVEAIAVRKLGTIRVVTLDDGRQQLVEVCGDEVPTLASLIAGKKAGQEALRGNYVDFINGLQYEIEYALLLEQILAISQGTKAVLLLLVF